MVTATAVKQTASSEGLVVLNFGKFLINISQNHFPHFSTRRIIGCLHDPANVQQKSSISTCILNTFGGSLLNVCWIMWTPHNRTQQRCTRWNFYLQKITKTCAIQ